MHFFFSQVYGEWRTLVIRPSMSFLPGFVPHANQSLNPWLGFTIHLLCFLSLITGLFLLCASIFMFYGAMHKMPGLLSLCYNHLMLLWDWLSTASQATEFLFIYLFLFS